MLMVKPKEASSKEGIKNFSDNEDNFWQNLTEDEPIDVDLFTACAIGGHEYVKTLIANTFDKDIINKSNIGGWTPLMYVCYVGNDKITELLIREGADVLLVEKTRGRTPLMLAASSGNITLIERLVENNARINRVDKHGQTALFHAAEHGQTKVVKYLLSIDADALISVPDTSSFPGDKPKPSPEILVFAHPHSHSILANHPSASACPRAYSNAGSQEALGTRQTLKCGFIFRQNGTGYTPFMEAAKQGHEGVFSTFIEHGVDFDLICNKGYTARDLAMQNKQYGANVIVNMIDNHCLKSPSLLRYEADLGDFGMEGSKQPFIKVNEWLKNQNTDQFFGDIVGELSNKFSEMQSHAIAIDGGYRTYSSDSFGKSVGDSTIADSDKTPLGTPVDSIFQQYMIRDLAQRRTHYDDSPSVETFLRDLGLERFEKLFEDASIDFNVFLHLTEEDLKELGVKPLGPRRRISTAMERWNEDNAEWPNDRKVASPEVNNFRLQLADVYSKLQHVTADLVREKEARALLEAEQMEGRARKSHMFFVAEKVRRACKELQTTNITVKKHVETLKTLGNENNKDELKSRLKELHKQMSEDTLNTDHISETIVRRVEKMICDDVTEVSSASDSPESSCTSFSRSENGFGPTSSAIE